jgi:hypothetical protein
MVKVTVESKECSNGTCRRIASGKFKLCDRCRTSKRKANKKILAPKTCNGNEKQCKCCGKVQEKDQFVSSHVRREKLTNHCLTCRAVAKRTGINPTTKTGKCKAVWEKWKAMHACLSCGCNDPRILEADHQHSKVHACSDYKYWAYHGGVEALKHELAKCVPLCRVCHRVKTKNERGTTTQQSFVDRHKIIDDEKLRRGTCIVCKRQVSKESTCAFDFDHIDPSQKVISLSNLVYKSKSYFNEHFRTEAQKCNLICCNCHHLKTHY